MCIKRDGPGCNTTESPTWVLIPAQYGKSIPMFRSLQLDESTCSIIQLMSNCWMWVEKKLTWWKIINSHSKTFCLRTHFRKKMFFEVQPSDVQLFEQVFFQKARKTKTVEVWEFASRWKSWTGLSIEIRNLQFLGLAANSINTEKWTFNRIIILRLTNRTILCDFKRQFMRTIIFALKL